MEPTFASLLSQATAEKPGVEQRQRALMALRDDLATANLVLGLNLADQEKSDLVAFMLSL